MDNVAELELIILSSKETIDQFVKSLDELTPDEQNEIQINILEQLETKDELFFMELDYVNENIMETLFGVRISDNTLPAQLLDIVVPMYQIYADFNKKEIKKIKFKLSLKDMLLYKSGTLSA